MKQFYSSTFIFFKKIRGNQRTGLLSVLLVFVFLLLQSWQETSAQYYPYTDIGFNGAAANLDQARNGSMDDPVTPVDWVNGNAGEQTAHYVEGLSIPYRAVLTGLPSVNPVTGFITIVLEYDAKSNGHYAIDYLTGFNRLTPHNAFGHDAEVVNPLYDESNGSWAMPEGTPSMDFPIPKPTGGTGDYTKLGTSFDKIPAAERMMRIYGGEILAIGYITPMADLASTGTATQQLWVAFRPTGATAVLAWGGHIGSRLDWGYFSDGKPQSAGGIAGSPYHMRLIDWNLDNLGNQDRSLSAAAAYVFPPCAITGPEYLCTSNSGTYQYCANVSTQPYETFTYLWTIMEATGSDASITGANNTQCVQVDPGTKAGTFRLRVIITNTVSKLSATCYWCPGGCSDLADPAFIKVFNVTASISPASTEICAGGTVKLTGTAGAGIGGYESALSYAWYDVDPVANPSAVPIGTALTLDVSPVTTGSHTYYFKASLPAGAPGVQAPEEICFAVAQATVIVNPYPVASMTATTSCGNLTVTFNNTSVCPPGSTCTYTYNYGDGSTGTSPTHTYSGYGTYNATITATSKGCSNTSAIVPVTLYRNQICSILRSPEGIVCPGTSVTLTAPEGPTGTKYEWILPAGVTQPSGTINDRIITVLMPDNCNTTVTIGLKVTGEGDCESTCNTDIVVKDDIAPVFKSTPSASLSVDCTAPAAYANYAAFVAAGGLATDNCLLDESSFTLKGESASTELCPQTIKRTYSIKDKCGLETTWGQTIVVNVPKLAVNKPGNFTGNACDYADQAALNTAFNNWLTGFSVTGGCSPSGSYGTPAAPLLCSGGTTTVTYKFNDRCENGFVTATFTLNKPSALIIGKPDNFNASSCDFTDQAALNAAFETWIKKFGVTGGCKPSGSFEGTPTAPLLCTGGVVTAVFNYYDLCDRGSSSATFTINAPPAVIINKPNDFTASACDFTDQTAMNAVFTDWVRSFGFTGGCKPTGSFEGFLDAPVLCTGGKIEATYKVVDKCFENSVKATFTINKPDPLVIGKPDNFSASSCDFADQAALNTAFENWLKGFNVTGGCKPVGSYGQPVVPVLCDGGVVTVTYDAVDKCEKSSASATFTIIKASDVNITAPNDFTGSACDFADQAAVNAAFSKWLEGFSVSGGCKATGSYGSPVAPVMCEGGTVTVTYTVTGQCVNGSKSAKFTISPPPGITFNKPEDFTDSACDFADQAALNTAFENWLKGFVVTGGCKPSGSFVGTPVAPLLCDGGTVEAEYYVTDNCAKGSKKAKFTITPPPAVQIIVPEDFTAPACNFVDQTILNIAFSRWLGGFNVTGGCKPVGSFGTPVAPPICEGGTVKVEYVVTDLCGKSSKTASFTITPPAAVNIISPDNFKASACDYSDQAALNTAFENWLKNFTATGGCKPAATFEGTPTAPELCSGGTVTVKYSVKDLCFSGSKTATFTIDKPAALVVGKPDDFKSLSCEFKDQAALNAAFVKWLEGFSVTGGCKPAGSYGTPVAPPLCEGGTVKVIYTFTDLCEKGSVSADFTVTASSLVLPPDGKSVVACLTDMTRPVPPEVKDNCGNIIVPVPGPDPKIPICEGDMEFTWIFRDCGGKELVWKHTVTIKMADFVLPADESSSVSCADKAVEPAPPAVRDNCGKILVPSAPVTGGTFNGCEGIKTYTFKYTDCAGHTHNWVYTYTIKMEPLEPIKPTFSTVACVKDIWDGALPPLPVVTDKCGNVLTPTGPVKSNLPTCEGTKTWTWTYTDCAGNKQQYVHTITVEMLPLAPITPTYGTVECVNQIWDGIVPKLPVVTDACGNVLLPKGPVKTALPKCAGKKTWTWTYTDCAGHSQDYVHTVEVIPMPFKEIAPTSATFACPADIKLPLLPMVKDNCGNILSPTGPVITMLNDCAGSRLYTWTYTDCAGNKRDYVHTVTIKPTKPFGPITPTFATVACVGDIWDGNLPPLPVVMDACGNILTPTGPEKSLLPGCEGSKTWTWTYTDCAGNMQKYVHTVTVEMEPFEEIAPTSATFTCEKDIVMPVLPVVKDNCGNVLSPIGPVSTALPGCKGSQKLVWTYKDCEGNTREYVHTVTIAPMLFGEIEPTFATVECPDEITEPVPPVVKDYCGNVITPSGPVKSSLPECNGIKTFTWTYTDCAGNTHDYVHTVTIKSKPFPAIAPTSATVENAMDIVMPVLPVVTDNCGRVLEPAGPVVSPMPDCEGDVTYTWTYKDCAGNTQDYIHIITIKGCVPLNHCTYTQGFYGNTKGKNCAFIDNTYISTDALTMMKAAFGDQPFVLFGTETSGKYFKLMKESISGSTTPEGIFQMIPGGGTPAALIGSATSLDEMSKWGNVPRSVQTGTLGKIKNNLLSQTITLFFNLGNDKTLGDVRLRGTYMVTEKSAECGSLVPVANSGLYTEIPQSVLDYFTANGLEGTVKDLFDLANLVLGGEIINPVVSAGDVTTAVDAINVGFDECRILVSFSNTKPDVPKANSTTYEVGKRTDGLTGETTEVVLTVYPNPFKSIVKFQLDMVYDSKVKVEIYSQSGQLLRILFNEELKQGDVRTAEFDASVYAHSAFLYKVVTNNTIRSGTIMKIK